MMGERVDERKGNDMTGADLIAAERRRQQEVEGYTAEHDATHHFVGEFVEAAGAYLGLPGSRWPWDADSFKPSADGYAERDLIKAGALIAAAIDRLRAVQR